MTEKQIISKVRVWGLRGIRDYFWRTLAYWYHARRLRLLARRAKGVAPSPGVTVIGDLTGQAAISKTLRDFILSLRDAGIPYQTYDVRLGSQIPRQDERGLHTPLADFNLRRYTHVAVMFHTPLQMKWVPDLKLVRIVFHETAAGLEAASPYLWDGRSTIVAMSDFNYAYYRKIFTSQPVAKITYPFRPKMCYGTPRNEVRKKYGIRVDDFVVFFNFDFGSYYRKNATGALRAFALAFKGLQSAKIVFKTKSAGRCPEQAKELEALVDELDIREQFVHISSFLPRADVDGLTSASDVYLSLHRGEGLGLGMVEAMSQGIPVVATGWSANVEFCTPETAYPVPYQIIPIQAHEYMSEMKEWADPDVSKAALFLREIYHDSQSAKRKAESGRRFVKDHFSLSNFKRDVEALLG